MSTSHDPLINLVAGTVRGWRGTMVRGRRTKTPQKLLKLYDMEASPYCRLVREVLTELDLDVMILPCPKHGQRFRPEAEKLGGKQQFLLLHDENTGDVVYESAAIIAHLHQHYGRGARRGASKGVKRQLAVGSSFVSSALLWRTGGITGLKADASHAPAQPLELYSFETSPFSKPVRARLCELEIPYILRNTGKGSWSDMGPPSFRDKLFKGPMGTTRNRQWLAERTGKVQVPYLVDANTETAMYESRDIIRHLNRHYAA